MPYVRVTDPFLNADKPGRSSDMKQIRDNQDYFDSQINTLLNLNLISSNSIADDFMGAGGATGIGAWWTTVLGVSDTVTVIGEHTMKCLTTGNTTSDFAGVYAADPYGRIAKSEEYVAVMEVRVKRAAANNLHHVFGWNDVGLGVGSANFTDQSDCVLVTGDGAGTWTASTVNASSSSSVGGFGTPANWEIIRLEFTCSATAGNRKVEVYLNDVLQGTLNTDANMPTAPLRPVLGCVGDGSGTARDLRFDYAIFTVQGRPLAA